MDYSQNMNVFFWGDVLDYEVQKDQYDLSDKAQTLWKNYFTPQLAIPISQSAFAAIERVIQSKGPYQPDLFDDALKEVLKFYMDGEPTEALKTFAAAVIYR